jgi:hypothetical protein
MANKIYYLKFGFGNPNVYTGLFPTLTVFSAQGLTALTAPGITELPAGTGLYQFSYFATQSIVFVADAGSSIASSFYRYLSGTLDPIQAVDQQLGFNTDSFGSTSIDPSTLYGLAKRVLENLEGDATFTKSTGVWAISNRGSSTLLRTKTLTNTTTSSGKT